MLNQCRMQGEAISKALGPSKDQGAVSMAATWEDGAKVQTPLQLQPQQDLCLLLHRCKLAATFHLAKEMCPAPMLDENSGTIQYNSVQSSHNAELLRHTVGRL